MFIEEDFTSFEEFIEKYPLDEITLPVGIQPPDDEGPYWLIQLAFPMKDKIVNACVWKATTHKISKYKLEALSLYKKAIGFDHNLDAKQKKIEALK